MSTAPPLTRAQAKGTPDSSGGTERRQRANSGSGESIDSDFQENTDDQKLATGKPATGKQTADKPAADKPAADKPAADKPAAAKPKGNVVPSREMISGGLKELVREHRQGLKNMYGSTETEMDEKLEKAIKRGEEMAGELVKMGCGPEVAKDLTVLTLYDLAILIDDSDSMISEENGQRKETLIQFVDYITEIYSLANESGVFAMRFMNRGGGKKNWKEKSRDYLDHHNYGGVTRIGTELKKKILDKFATGNSKQSKPLLVLIVTDGAIEGERKGHLENVIRDCVNERAAAGKGFEAVTFQFSRIGDDPGAAKLLEDLDQHEGIGQYIDVLQVEFDLGKDLEDKWWVLPKILLGAILPKWDEQDYYNYTKQKDLLADENPNPKDDDSGDDWDD